MNRNKVISLAAPGMLAAVTVFYDRYRERITDIKTVQERNCVLSDMQQDFERRVKAYPQSRNELSRIYELLKVKCWEVGLYGNG